ncbi:MAG TPA: tRNA (adenosine(37)-N6)-threonylcarbamoyltransferase complex ATPase subunit type 1 TsaE [Arachidicoccus soli]|uniref:tRNA threonylcarbamoyladenosine biosynthesis protein TsaE n=1 Tax=Arachidicoccus soli TaxID=2341117 RepID=A0A386HKB9_9BACT|nr:tRNA (adenosine(37)-N6)-threonylcarbamoyltransferase complex ATPase subunit type 1 TsaE [Arachidicoccus soli]AYD46165.1 tRNA (adenosine(37)-N6)-threonylcarbamoyltransferase complex ATPase subunit type 1 TsaE [Arachidicoccus soli]HEU0227542.1 tRNA (adenosine(37)-N6)-threonylcarbamoyltransferase complex ATPase subunit type 1 TsaE [Arachidicoccus soli]
MSFTFTQENIQEVAEKLWLTHSDKKIWAFYAPMGAGKTTFIKTLCNEVLKSKDIISSPTFAIINEYESTVADKIFHMDWYRLEDEDEAIQTGVEEVLMGGYLCLVEWPEKAPMLLPEDTLFLEIDILSESERMIFEKK